MHMSILSRHFAVSGGQRAGEFYTAPEVSEPDGNVLDPLARRNHMRSRLWFWLIINEMWSKVVREKTP